MKVRVAYTLDHDEVPKLVDEIIASCREELKAVSNFKFDVRDVESAANEVIFVQTRLDVVAGKLEDCLNLCRGYDSVTKPSPPPLEEAEDA
mgnify:CR=1 FL=1|jgi:hypothetical protein